MDILKDVRRDVAKFVGDSGSCPEDARVADAINDARRVLYKLGDWHGTVDSICIIAYEGFYTLPHKYDYAKQAHKCCQPVVVENHWYSHVGSDACGNYLGVVKRAPGQHVQFRDWPKIPCGNGFYVRAIFESADDIGTEIKIHASGVNRNSLSLTRTASEAWAPHDAKIGEQRITNITYVIKPKMAGRVLLFGYDGANEILLAILDPDDVNPLFARYYATRKSGQIVLKAKKKFIRLDNDDEPVDISTEALIHALQAITDRESRNMNGFASNINLATGYLNRELHGPESTSTSPIQFSPAYRVEGLI